MIDKKKTVETKVLIDSGAGGTFMDKEFSEKQKVDLIPLEKPIKVFNVDGTLNKVGMITHCTWVKIQIRKRNLNTWMLKQTVVQKIKRSFRATIEEVVDDSNEGKPGNTPSEDWQPLLLTIKEAEEEGDLNLLRTYLGKDTPETQTEDTTWIQANQTKAQEFAQLAEEKDEKPKTLLPEFYKKYASVFDKDTSK